MKQIGIWNTDELWEKKGKSRMELGTTQQKLLLVKTLCASVKLGVDRQIICAFVLSPRKTYPLFSETQYK